jgi:DEAD/DEAH box helicase domain-containing protein
MIRAIRDRPPRAMWSGQRSRLFLPQPCHSGDRIGIEVLDLFLQWLNRSGNYHWTLAHNRVFPEKAPQLSDIPAELHPRVAELVRASGITHLFSHQAEAVSIALSGRNVVLATETASGKTLAFHAAVLDRLIRDPKARALFLFPLKALERDQRDAFLTMAGQAGMTAAVYDGDTPEAERRKIRSRPPRVLITNPDMLHVGLLAYHDVWREFFGNLAHVVLDEVHTYKGIFGSHISQVLVRLLRVCALHGAKPQFIACSATIANPGTFLSRLTGQEVEVVDQSGAPAAERHFLFVNPILSPYTVASRLFSKALESGLKTIVFTRERKITELITTWVLQETPELRGRISSYRGGFLPEERREIEAKLFSGRMDGVISTSALEMGIDVGGLDLCVLVGYPGTIVNTWQRGGRVGRGGRPSAIVLIAGNDALDQYFIRNPEDFFDRQCEEAVLDPLNSEVLKRHIPCAAAEAPIDARESWIEKEEVQSVLKELEQSGALHRGQDGSWRSSVARPQRDVDLRAIGPAFSIFLEDGKTAIGSASGMRALTECHEGAVYLHRAKQYVVTKLDLKRRNALVKPSRLSYYTRALSEKDTEILRAPIRSRQFPGYAVHEAWLKVTQRIVGYEKRRTSGQDLIGTVELDLPPLHFETVGIWIEIPDNVKQAIEKSKLHFMGGIHALEHAAISVFPLFALCDRDDIGGISTPEHPQVCRAAVFIYDGHAGGVGLSHRAFDIIEDLLLKTRLLVEKCPCDDGCPSCIHSPKCGSGNKPLDKKACLHTLNYLMDPEAAQEALKLQDQAAASPPKVVLKKNTSVKLDGERMSTQRKDTTPNPIFPDLAAPAAKPPTRLVRPARTRDVVVFDLETQKLADEVGGWGNICKMRVSLGVAYTEKDGFLTFTEQQVPELIALLKSAELVVGFNQLRFDYEVLRPYTAEDLRALPNLDILAALQTILGYRLSLNHLAEFTLSTKKSGSGLDAAQWFREGRLDLIERYCRDDVRITRDLYRFGVDNGFLRYRQKNGEITRVQVNW